MKDITVKEAIERLRNSSLIREKQVTNNISSFNFTRKAFQKKQWNNISVRARGLFIDTKKERIKARSYDKFFAIEEYPETKIEYIKENWEYPIEVFVKENGYLGICSWNEDGTLFTATKSCVDGPYADRFRKLLFETLKDKQQEFCNFLRNEDLSAVFEVIDPEFDSHIIEYDKPQIVLLDLIYNSMFNDNLYLNFWNKSWEIVKMISYRFNFSCKQYCYRLWNAQEFQEWYDKVKVKNYQYQNQWIEGFVLQDFHDPIHMVKVKTDYYMFWKSVRSIIPIIRKGENINLKWINIEEHPEIFEIMTIIHRVAKQYYEDNGQDIDVITIRRMWEKEYGMDN